jgi:hypothetical protein
VNETSQLPDIPSLFRKPFFPRRRRGNGKSGKFFTGVGLAIIVSTFAAGYTRAEKIRTAIPQANLNYLSIYVADARGFFKDEGLENETVVISGPLATAALLSGDVDFSGGGGSGMRAALKGAPVIPSAEGIKNFLEYDIKIPLGFKEDIPPERLLQLQLV